MNDVKTVSRLLLMLSTVVLMLVSTAGVASARAAEANRLVRADLITEVRPLGWRVVAVALEYESPVRLGRARIPTSAFTVTATLNGVTAERTVVDVYVNNRAERDTRGAQGRPGRFIIIELSADDPHASALFWTGVMNEPYPLVGAYAIRQTRDIVDAQGGVQVPASPFAVTNQGVLNPIVDDFVSMVYTDSAGTSLPFRLFRPQTTRARTYPLVVFLHGSGERGTNNLTQITANQGAVAFAAPQRQSTDPSFVLAPQAPPGLSWTTPQTQAALLELIDVLAGSHPIDRDRLYLTGLSMGGIGGFDILPRHPDVFAAALLIAARGDVAQMPLMTEVPLWATHSVDDPAVNFTTGTLALINALEAAGARVTRGEWAGDLPERAAEMQAQRLWDAAEAAGSHILLTAFTAGTTPVNAHWSWVPTYSNDVMLDWLFSHRLLARERPAGDSAGTRPAPGA